MASDEIVTYPLNQSPFFRLRNHRKLANLLHVSQVALKRLVESHHLYRCWDEPKKNGSARRIEAPPENLKIVQRRISDLLQRINPPSFLMAPVKRRSYVHNAAAHLGADCFRLLDIEDFFPSCTDRRVFWFFNKRLECSTDIADTLTKIATLNERLPQGSPCSPILAYFAYCDMWEKIGDIVTAANCTLSIYADDITISGKIIYERDIWAIKQVLHGAGHRYNHEKERSIVHKAVEITGVIVKGDELLLPNRQHRELSKVRKQRQVATGVDQKSSLDRKLRGRIAQAQQITNHLNRSGRI